MEIEFYTFPAILLLWTIVGIINPEVKVSRGDLPWYVVSMSFLNIVVLLITYIVGLMVKGLIS